ELFHEKISSLREYDQAQADCKSSSAAVAAAEAALGQAGLNLGYTTIIAPFDGWVGINTVDSGNYLSAPSQTLAEVLYINQVKVEFHLSDAYLNGEFRRAIVSGVPPEWPVYLQLRNGEKYPLPGKISFWENEISTTTASITVQALFDNPDYLLLPGLYVTVILENPAPEEVLLLDRRSLRNEQGNYFVMLITPRQTLEFRPVEVGDVVGEKIIIRSGLTAGEQVAIAGNVLLQPGTKVNVIGSKK
ncbi:MAG: efflux RND transporter periplasmic adaptor subunit, partial [Victivallaceae bacterium]